MFQHVGWSLRHVLFSDMFSTVSNLFSTSLVYACPVYGRSGMLFLLLISRGTVFVFASFVLLACSVCYVPACWMVAPACCFYHFLHVYLPACFFFPRVSACLILACLSTFFFRPAAFLAHTHTHLWPGAGLARDRQSPTALHVFFFACLRMSCLWSLWHVVSTYIFSACLPFSACLSSGMFLLSACFGMFDFGMFKYFLLSACCIPHTHTCGQVLVLFVVATTGRAQLRLSNAVQRRHDRFCFLHAGFHHVVPHTHLRPGAGLARGRYDRQGPTALEQTGRAQLRLSNAVQRRHDVREILQLSCSNKIARMKPLCLCNCRRYLSSELLGRRTGACLTA